MRCVYLLKSVGPRGLQEAALEGDERRRVLRACCRPPRPHWLRDVRLDVGQTAKGRGQRAEARDEGRQRA